MENWNAELLVQVIRFLNSTDAASFSLQSRRFFYVVKQYQKLCDPMIASQASIEGGTVRNPRQSSAEGIYKSAISNLQAPPQMAVSFSRSEDVTTLPEVLRQRCPKGTVILHTVANSIQSVNSCQVQECETSSSRSLMLLSGLHNSRIQPIYHAPNVDREQEGADLSLVVDPSVDWTVFILNAVQHVGGLEEFVQQLQTRYPNAIIVGGVCSQASVSLPDSHLNVAALSNLSDLEVMYIYNQLYPSQGNNTERVNIQSCIESIIAAGASQNVVVRGGNGTICGVAIAGDDDLVRVVVTRGVSSMLDQPMEIVDSHSANEGILMISQVKDPLTNRLLMPSQVLAKVDNPDFIGVQLPGEDGFSLCSAEIFNDLLLLPANDVDHNAVETLDGSALDLFAMNSDSVLADIDLCMTKLQEQTINQSILGGIMISCNGRGPSRSHWVHEHMADASRFGKTFPGIPMLGYYAGGEIGPKAKARRQNVFQTGNSCVQGFTAVFVLFIVPKRDRRTYDLDDQVDKVDAFIQEHLHEST